MPARTLLILSSLLLAAGCSKVTLENYNKVQAGMRYDEVTALLGKPDSCSEVLKLKSCRWGDDQRHAIINFVGDEVVLTSAENLR